MVPVTDPVTDTIKIPTCSICHRERTLGGLGSEHPMDTYDYTPMQVITNSAMGWYSGDDGEVCPEDMERTIRGQ